MGNTCKPMAVSFQCMTKFTTNKKKKKKKFLLWLIYDVKDKYIYIISIYSVYSNLLRLISVSYCTLEAFNKPLNKCLAECKDIYLKLK